jgi:beta-N-acetylhexosaminidase
VRKPRLLVAVDHEGGRVQRFRDGFTRLPAIGNLGELYQSDPVKACRMARVSGWLMAIELRAVGIDLSFAPVLDLGRNVSGVVGDRAFHEEPEVVADLGRAYMIGMRRAGMEATGKHFPGHGSVVADSHYELPVDNRDLEEIAQTDMIPFERLAHYGIAAIMAAHVVYPRIADEPAGFSRFWLQDVLRKRIGFQGLVFTDDLDMAAAAVAGAPEDRARMALQAGCDMVLACNDRPAMIGIVEGLADLDDPVGHLRLVRMHGRGQVTPERLAHSNSWQRAVRLVREYDTSPLLDMDL